MRQRRAPWPDLIRPPASFLDTAEEDVDARVKPGQGEFYGIANAGHGVTLRGSKASRTASPMKMSRLSITASTAKAVMPSQGACKLALPWASSSPSEAEPGGRPKPRKSSEVKVVIEPFRMNGMKVIVATVAFGNTWRQMMTGSETPRARAART